MTSYPRTGAESQFTLMIAPPWRYHVRVQADQIAIFGV